MVYVLGSRGCRIGATALGSDGFLQRSSTKTAGSTYYYLSDALGSIRQVIDSNEATQTRRGGTPRRGRRPHSYDYFAFGKQYGTPTEYLTQPFRFTRRAWDFAPSTVLRVVRVSNHGDGNDDYGDHSGQQGTPEAEAWFRERVGPRV